MIEGSSDVDRFACVSCGDPVPVDEVTCPSCGYGHVDTEELWAIGVLSPPVFLLFAVLVLWALDTFVPTAYGTLGPRGVVLVVAVLFAVPLAQFLRDHVAYRRGIARARGDGTPWPSPVAVPSVDERLERLVVTARVGAIVVLVARLGATVGPGPGYATAFRLAELAGGALLLHAGASTYRLREELRLRMHLERLVGAVRRGAIAGVRRTVAGARAVATGLAPYVTEVVRGSRSVASDVRATGRRIDAERRRLSERWALPVGREGAAITADRLDRLWERAIVSIERHWPAWGVVAVVELWVVAFQTGVGVTYLTETMLATWLGYTYFLFEDVAITRERYDWDPWWWSYSVRGLLPIVNIGVGTVYLLRRELVRRAVVGGEDEEAEDGGESSRRPDPVSDDNRS